MDDKHTVRQAILAALLEHGRRPMTVADLARATAVTAAMIGTDDLRRELPGLVAHGYIADLMPTRGGLYRLDAAGRDQITLDAELDEYVHGADAYIG